MPRSGKIKKKLTEPDLVYKSRMVSKLINKIMWSGKKSVAQKIVYDAFSFIKEKEKKDPLDVFNNALKNVNPKIEVKARRVGGASYQVPMEVKGNRRDSLSIRWIVDAARSKDNKEYKTMVEKLAVEIIAASKNEGEAIKKKELVHKMAESNKAFAFFKW
ncbi:30S ribosomal protein S7 [candidate division CPR3 bacterium GWF2_35_18]|uniref:Small ribosomal subunit protein uS7 n=1 Tax=candidate division CPR3 bacterium GW2011_GWF2_35_18 TaxID=1618350 RepID=A0A0G0BJU3_UNCC3|nr:MAG: 30S ribosomal protein S7 [candidate division CPR3 bacterium GW2011_GWF2_35_18]KKP85911.1 MAG: 30S ribosomal protein S7 [candidate division CPR3 bacterium GW2011_GWE2_35_7]OGB63177.1 MAG: 30S ribosomal protein S7 [candidate division CPR3 bacterium GWF2_35_18]OGB64009.1 MAG: 30S ribosomal protein S7 [candidate division CPR3 bacterium RIFOXYA2_FULL_35_13]OGB79598.1 MAG: 30S ribosomal protein S7 [candidate division CPR3 bacterium RIFOXYB2_FULL_35_8]OGB80097.1 MAG: 30S ribosomal protein S7 